MTNLHHLCMLAKSRKLFLRLHSSNQTFGPPLALLLPVNAAADFWHTGGSDRWRRMQGSAHRSWIACLTCAWYGIVCSTYSTEKVRTLMILYLLLLDFSISESPDLKLFFTNPNTLLLLAATSLIQ